MSPPSNLDKLKQPDKDDSSWRQLTERFKLSACQVKVLRLLLEGETQKAISGKMHCTRGAVKSHVHRIYEKLGVRTAAQLGVRVAEFFADLYPKGDRR
ncbi:MAG: helix-turn-helix transcriptional regulator [Gemmataceae bacterium]|nr:helix-turn-helix transcriptional regulator [Gemmataceae bacterium]